MASDDWVAEIRERWEDADMAVSHGMPGCRFMPPWEAPSDVRRLLAEVERLRSELLGMIFKGDTAPPPPSPAPTLAQTPAVCPKCGDADGPGYGYRRCAGWCHCGWVTERLRGRRSK